jgi:hypothetical protein
VRVKQANIAKGTSRWRTGDQWTFVAIDPDTKLIGSVMRIGGSNVKMSKGHVS